MFVNIPSAVFSALGINSHNYALASKLVSRLTDQFRSVNCCRIYGRVVKGVNFVQLRDAGDPVEIAKAYDAAGEDELVFLDITASCEQRDTVVDMVRRVAAKIGRAHV